jgi:asparagine synthetase A
VRELFAELRNDKYADFPEELTFIHAEEILERYPDLPRKQRETKIIQEYPAVFIYGIGWPLAASRCTASTATSWFGTLSRDDATSSARWVSGSPERP